MSASVACQRGERGAEHSRDPCAAQFAAEVRAVAPAALTGNILVSWIASVDQAHQGRGYGRFLLADALFRAVRSEIASFAIIVHAKDEAARRFYERESFLPLLEQALKLFRPMTDIAKLFESKIGG